MGENYLHLSFVSFIKKSFFFSYIKHMCKRCTICVSFVCSDSNICRLWQDLNASWFLVIIDAIDRMNVLLSRSIIESKNVIQTNTNWNQLEWKDEKLHLHISRVWFKANRHDKLTSIFHMMIFETWFNQLKRRFECILFTSRKQSTRKSLVSVHCLVIG